MDQLPEYFYGETLRWNYGFENPNKAAVLWACLVPFFWALWLAAWRLKSLWLRVPALALTAAAFLGSAYCLFMTFSRGGLVAAALGVAYVGIRTWWRQDVAQASRLQDEAVPRRDARAMWGMIAVSGLLILAAGGLMSWIGLAERAVDPLAQGDASVTNRLVLWKAGVQMAAENPTGFGAGESGAQYMKWYQPVESQEGYRTMVNSYLTLLVEQGYLLFLAGIFVAALLWFWLQPSGNPGAYRVALGLRGLLLTFAVAGVFSTTFEEPRIWILPVLALMILAIWQLWQRRGPVRSQVFQAAAVTAGAGALLFAAGIYWSLADPLRREFARKDGKLELQALEPRAGATAALAFYPDAAVFGGELGAMMRRLALEGGVRVELEPKLDASTDYQLIAGERIFREAWPSQGRYILVAPAALEEEQWTKLFESAGSLLVLLPDIDEDGRVDFWNSLGDGEKRNAQFASLPGVGNQVSWAWDDAIVSIREHIGRRDAP